MLEIYPQLGIIKGGNAERIFIARKKRFEGGEICWQRQKNLPGHTVKTEGKYKILMAHEVPGIPWFYRNDCRGDQEIGYRRVTDILFPKIIEQDMTFTEVTMLLWLNDLASFEFGIHSESPLSIITLGEGIQSGLAPPYLDSVYKQWINKENRTMEVK